MSKYIIDYYDKNGDYSHEWVEASSPKEAEVLFRHETWNVDHIVNIYKR